MPSDRPRPPRSNSGGPSRPSGPRKEGRSSSPRPERRESEDPRSTRPRRSDSRPSGPRSEGDGARRPRADGDSRSQASRWRSEEAPAPRRSMTAAERKSLEVKARTGGRRTSDEGPSFKPTSGKVEWIDEGDVRNTARKATKRAVGGQAGRGQVGRGQVGRGQVGRGQVGRGQGDNRVPGIPRSDRPLPADVARDVEKGVGARQTRSAEERLQKAIDAFEHERYDEASRLLQVLSRQLPRMALVHEMSGLCAYRQAKWRTVVNELEATRVLDPARLTVLPVLADAYRALRRWTKVRDIWNEIKELSPHPAVLAEARIVAAGALADQSKLPEAVAMFDSVLSVPKRVQDYHLRQWYMAADLHDRSGNVVEARRLFARVMQYDPDFVDVSERLDHIGPPRR